MRKAAFIWMLSAVAAAVLMPSCSSLTYNTATGKTLSMNSEITTMPTVVDLDVDGVMAKRDTTWSEKTFKPSQSKKAIADVLVAGILQEADADVLVEPKEKFDAKVSWRRKEYSLSISGYPARYTNFRPATKVDVELLNAMENLGNDDAVLRGSTIVVNAGAPYPYAVGRGEYTVPVETPQKQEPAKEKKKEEKPRPRYCAMVDLGLGCDFNNMGFSMNISTSHGARLGHYVYLGGGVGYSLLCNNYYDYCHVFSFFGHFRIYMGKKTVRPYWDWKLGLSLHHDEYYDYYGYYYDEGTLPSLLFETGPGLQFGRHMNLKLAYITNDPDDISDHSLQLKLGWVF